MAAILSPTNQWFGDIAVRHYLLVLSLLEVFEKLKQTNPEVTRAETFFIVATMKDTNNGSFLSVLDDELKDAILKIWEGTATNHESNAKAIKNIFNKAKAKISNQQSPKKPY